jgi:predicted glycogen debranching enzyme
MYFRIDNLQGTSYIDDNYVPGSFSIPINSGSKTDFVIVATAAREAEATEALHETSCNEAENFENFYRKQIGRIDSFIRSPLSLHQKTIGSRLERPLVCEDWGRDALISLPGLTLVTHRFDQAKEILLTFKQYCHKGLIPNRFPEKTGGTPIYNTVDATLWYINAVLQYLKYTGDYTFIKENLWETLKSVIDRHIQGTINNIHLDNDGLIEHGPQLTWMDAVINNNPVTPRNGKAVEIQSLWFNALNTMVILANRFGYTNLADKYADLAKKASSSFIKKFWNDQRGQLLDVVNQEPEEKGVRPNQIFAVSLDFSMLSKKQQAAVVSTLQTKLWTKWGLRTLSADDVRYRGRYCDTWEERNLSYHNGTIWPWLTGPFTTAFLRAYGFEAENRAFVLENFLSPLFKEQTQQAGLGTISEIFDGDSPHSPRGCLSQAWSVAEPLRSYFEDVCLIRGEFEKEILGYDLNEIKKK